MTDIPRTYPPVPLIGVGALIIHDEKIALVRRGAPPAQGQWSVPGGLVEVGEPLRMAAAREAFEETALTVEPLELVELVERILPDQHGLFKYHYVIADFLCRFRGGEIKAGSDVDDAIWTSEADLSRLDLAPLTERVVRKAFGIARRKTASENDFGTLLRCSEEDG